MMADATERFGDAPHNFVYGNVQQDPPLALAEFADADVIAHPCALQIIEGAMQGSGPPQGLKVGLGGNTNLPGSRTQPVHRDGAHNGPSAALRSFVVNIAMSDTDERNGSIEVWPGTHLENAMQKAELESGRRWRGNVRPDVSEARRKEVPPVRVNTELGDLMLRDMQMWHR